MADTLGTRIADRDAEVFVGRDRELDALSRLLADDPPATVAYVHGTGGVGKSALLRALTRHADRRGTVVERIDGGDVGSSTETLDALIDVATHGEVGLLILDAFERMAALASHLRRHVLPRLPATIRVVIASRQPPDAGWRSEGWDTVMSVVAVDLLNGTIAERLLRARGIGDDESVARLVQWGAGLPLALTIAADATLVDPTLASSGDIDVELADALLGGLLDVDGGFGSSSAVAVAATARHADAELFASVLPESGSEGFAWLARRSFVDRDGDDLVLHERAAAAVRAQMRHRHPERERELRRRVLEHLFERIQSGRPWLVEDLPLLIDDPVVRYALGVESTGIVGDQVRDGDLPSLRAAREAREEPWLPSLDRWFHDAAEHVIVLRSGHEVSGAGVCLTTTWFPDWVEDDPVAASWIAATHTGALPDRDAVFLRSFLDVVSRPGDAVSEVLPVGNTELLRRTKTPNPRWIVVLAPNGDDRGDAFLDAMGYRTVPGLKHREAGVSFRTVVRDLGPEGLAGTMREMVLADLGLPVSAPPLRADDVRHALRNFHDPVGLSHSPLARGDSVDVRADSVRSLIEAAVDSAFGADDEGRLQRSVVELGYLDPDGGHAVAAKLLHLSRSSYFRRLSHATDLLSQVIAEERSR